MARSQANIAGVDAVEADSFTAKGDIPVGTAAGAFAMISVGADDEVLVADSAEAAGVKWAARPMVTAADLGALRLYQYSLGQGV